MERKRGRIKSAERRRPFFKSLLQRDLAGERRKESLF